MNAALRAALRARDGVGDLDGAGVRTGRAEHPVCGDEVCLQVRLAGDGTIADLAWRADGCPATLAVASIARGALRGRDPAEAGDAIAARLDRLGGLARHERHAESMLLRALADAIGGDGRRDGDIEG